MTVAKRTAILCAVAFLLGVAATLSLTCNANPSASPVPAPHLDAAPAPPVLPLAPDTIVQQTLIKGKPYAVHDTLTDSTSNQIDTVRITRTVTVTRDTCLPSKPVSLPAGAIKLTDVLAAFKSSCDRNALELWACGEHDLFGGYGGNLEADLVLDELHIAPATIYLSAGVTRGFTAHAEARAALGVKGKLFGIGGGQ